MHRAGGDPVRNQLISAAIEVVTRDGLAAATTRRISEQAGLPLGTFHYWFSNKEELFECLFEEILKEIEESTGLVDGAWQGEGQAVLQLLQSAFSVVSERGEEGIKRQIVPYELTMLALRTPAFRDFARRQYELYRQVATNMAGPLLDDIDPASSGRTGCRHPTCHRIVRWPHPGLDGRPRWDKAGCGIQTSRSTLCAVSSCGNNERSASGELTRDSPRNHHSSAEQASVRTRLPEPHPKLSLATYTSGP